jgi:hypothetical protein
MYAIGQEVMVTITDRRNSHSPVTVVRGVIVNGTKQIAKIVDKHPVWHGCEIASSPSVRIQRDWNSKPRTAEAESIRVASAANAAARRISWQRRRSRTPACTAR